jgi:hypothetical protein
VYDDISARAAAGQPPTEASVQCLELLGKTIMNASAFHEHNRVKQALAILKPGAEDNYGTQRQQALLGQDAIAALQMQRDAEKLADKLHVAGRQTKSNIQNQSRGGRQRQQQNSRPGPQTTAAPAGRAPTAANAAKGKGRGRGRN